MPKPIGPANRHLTAFFSPQQRALGKHASRHEVDKANEAALEQAIDASLQHDDGLTAAQKFARETGDPALIQESNDAALALAMNRSLDPAQDAPKTGRSTVPAHEFRVQRGLIAKLKRWLVDQGFVIKKNNGNSNNCLIISMLQHVTGNYASNHTREAARYKAMIVAWSRGQEKSSSALFSDDALAEKLIDQMNKDHFGEQTERYIRFKFVTADLDGNPAVRELGKGPRSAGIVDGGGHYEAYLRA